MEGEPEAPRKIDALPELKQVFDLLSKKLDGNYDDRELSQFLETFDHGCKEIKNIYERSGYLGGIGFRKCDLFDHNWHHVQGNIAMVAKILPGYLQKYQEEKGQVPQLEEIEDLFWATLLHDMGWLRTDQEASEGLYKWGGEKFFVHCQQGVEKAPLLLKGLEEKGVAVSLDETREGRIKKFIKRTEFNPSEEEKEEVEIDKNNFRLSDVLRIADSLSYFCKPDDIPSGVQNLFKEGQAIARIGCNRTKDFFEAQLGQNKLAVLDLSKEELRQRFEQGRLTIADLKFPGQTALEFVASGYLESRLEEFEPWLGYVDKWFDDEANRDKNKDRNNYYTNIAKIKAIQALASISRSETSLAFGNPLCYLTGSLTGRDLREVAIAFGLEDSLDINWDRVDKRTLGVLDEEDEGQDIFQRLVTPEVKKIIRAAPAEKRQEVLELLLERFVIKHQVKQKVNGNCLDEYWLVSVAPGNYLEEHLLEAEQIFTAFERINKQNIPGAPLLKPGWIIRRDEDLKSKNLDQWSKEIIALKKMNLLDRVVIAGKETTAHPTLEFTAFIKDLTAQGIEVIIHAGQVMNNQPKAKDLARENILGAIEIAKKNQRVRIIGLQMDWQKDFDDDGWLGLRALGEKGQLIVMPATDLETQELHSPVNTLESHPIFFLREQGVQVKMAVPHAFTFSMVEMEAVKMAATEKEAEAIWTEAIRERERSRAKPVILTAEEKINILADYYIGKASEVLISTGV